MPPQVWQQALDEVLSGQAFAGATAHQRFLRYLVAHEQAGTADGLKETVLGIEVFQRPADRFDPRRDSIVRVEARRLRERLRRHHAQPGGGAWLIVMPTGGYRLQLVARPAADDRASQAQELVTRGTFFLRQGHEAGYRKALQRFHAAAELMPSLAEAHAGLARTWLQLVATSIEPPQPGVQIALEAARRALALQPRQPDALVLVAQLTHRFEFDWTAARAGFERALRLAPQSALVRQSQALSLMMRGDFDAAAAALAVARQLDPLHLSLRAHQALLALYRRQWEAAEGGLQALLDLSPDNVLGMSLLAYVHLCRGEPEAAFDQYARVAQVHPQLSIGSAGQAWALARAGQTAAARQRLCALQAAWRTRYLSPYQLAMAEVFLDERAAALALLERAVQDRDPNAICLPVDPAFDGLHGEPRFKALRCQVSGSVRSAGG